MQSKQKLRVYTASEAKGLSKQNPTMILQCDVVLCHCVWFWRLQVRDFCGMHKFETSFEVLLKTKEAWGIVKELCYQSCWLPWNSMMQCLIIIPMFWQRILLHHLLFLTGGQFSTSSLWIVDTLLIRCRLFLMAGVLGKTATSSLYIIRWVKIWKPLNTRSGNISVLSQLPAGCKGI